MASEPALAGHWDDAYAQGDTCRSWFQPEPVLSLRMLAAAGVTATARNWTTVTALLEMADE